MGRPRRRPQLWPRPTRRADSAPAPGRPRRRAPLETLDDAHREPVHVRPAPRRSRARRVRTRRSRCRRPRVRGGPLPQIARSCRSHARPCDRRALLHEQLMQTEAYAIGAVDQQTRRRRRRGRQASRWRRTASPAPASAERKPSWSAASPQAERTLTWASVRREQARRSRSTPPRRVANIRPSRHRHRPCRPSRATTRNRRGSPELWTTCSPRFERGSDDGPVVVLEVLKVLEVARVDHVIRGVVVAPRAPDVFGESGPTTVDARRQVRRVRIIDLFDNNIVLAVVAEVVGVGHFDPAFAIRSSRALRSSRTGSQSSGCGIAMVAPSGHAGWPRPRSS